MDSSAASLTRRRGFAGSVGSDHILLLASPSGRKRTVQRAVAWSSAASSLDKRKTNPMAVKRHDSHSTSGSVWGFQDVKVFFTSTDVCQSEYLHVGDVHLFQTTWGWKSLVLPAVCRFWGCSRSCFSCGCCSDTHCCDTTLHTETHTTTMLTQL